MSELALKGLFPPIPTPFDGGGAIDHAALMANLERWDGQPLSGYVAGGSNGEFALLSIEERLAVIAAVKSALPEGRLLIAGSGLEATVATADLTCRMADLGADAALIVTPGYYRGRMDVESLTSHYLAIAERSPIPIILYNIPANTGVDLPVEAAVRLAEHPRIIGMKDSSGNLIKLATIRSRTPERFQLLAGSAGFLLGALAIGAVGAVAALANIAAEPLHQLLTAFAVGELDLAKSIQLRLVEANSAVTTRFGVAGLKAAMDMLGYFGGKPRLPLLPLAEHEQATLRQILLKAELLSA
jgi:4-hydroxy-2-oxoglutarate aldolase